MGNQVYLIEKEDKVGGRVLTARKLFSSGENGKDVIEQLVRQIKQMTNIQLFTNATLGKVSGSVGNYYMDVNVNGELLKLHVGSVLVTTGFDFYSPGEGEYGFNMSDRVMSLQDFNMLVEGSNGQLMHNGQPVKTIAYIYCVGNRQSKGENKYCSRQCCTAAIHSSLNVHEKFKGVKAFICIGILELR